MLLDIPFGAVELARLLLLVKTELENNLCGKAAA